VSATIAGSFHNHPAYCDGSGSIDAYAEAARAVGLPRLGLSSHAPVPFACSWAMPIECLPSYCAEVRAAQVAYRGRVRVWLGLELDYLSPALVAWGAAFQREHVLVHRPEYLVASVHFVGRDADGLPWAIDESAEVFARQLDESYAGDARRLVEDYYRLVAEMALTAPAWGVPVIAGHVDRVKIWNAGERYFAEDAPWYLAALEGALQAIRSAGLVMEVNTSGLRRGLGEPFPGPRVLHRCKALGIPVTISSDAHRPEDLLAGFEEASALLRDVGYRETVTLDDTGWVRCLLR
jgi:histidinol-phosphatase (PHP family)